ncbi:MAG: glycosyltransferase family 2 protein [Campylobacterales bacterium]|nr:glycosyltransferase family 2 protein [Campylobacterales bacterium]
MIDVSIIIVNYNTKELLKNCIESILEKTSDINYEVIVFDNLSTDDNYSFLKDYPNVKPILSKENLGFGRGNNKAVESATGKYLFFLNPDTILHNNAVKKFFDYFEANSQELGALGCYLSDEEGDVIHSFAEFKRVRKTMIGKYEKSIKRLLFLDVLRKKKQNKSYHKIDETKEVDYITGADLFMTKSLFEKIGGFDEEFFMYYEETEMQYRISKLGLKRVVINTPEIAHLEGQSFNNKPSNVRRKMYGVAETIYVRKVSGSFNGLVYKGLYIMNILIDTIIDLYRFRYTPKENLDYLFAVLKEKPI